MKKFQSVSIKRTVQSQIRYQKYLNVLFLLNVLFYNKYTVVSPRLCPFEQKPLYLDILVQFQILLSCLYEIEAILVTKTRVLFGYYLLTFRPLVPKHPKIIKLQFLRQYFLNIVLHTTNMFTNMYLLIANMKMKTNELCTTIKNLFLIDNFS